MNLFNLTGYGAVSLPSMGRDGQDLVLGRDGGAVPAAASERFTGAAVAIGREEQLDPPLADVYCGPLGGRDCRLKARPHSPAPPPTIVVAGHARALHDEPVTSLSVRGQCWKPHAAGPHCRRPHLGCRHVVCATLHRDCRWSGSGRSAAVHSIQMAASSPTSPAIPSDVDCC